MDRFDTGRDLPDRHHVDCIPRAAIQERTVRTLSGAFRATDTGALVDLNAAEGRIVRIGHPKHASFNRTVFDTGGRARATGTAISCDGQNPGSLFSRSLSVPDGHRPLFFDNVVHQQSFVGSMRLAERDLTLTWLSRFPQSPVLWQRSFSLL